MSSRNLNIVPMLVSLLLASIGFSQQNQSVQKLFDDYQYAAALTEIARLDTSKMTPAKKAEYYYLSGRIHSKLNNSDVACDNFMKAKEFYVSLDDTNKAQQINLELATTIYSQSTKYDGKKYINEYMEYANSTQNPLYLARGHKQLATIFVNENPRESIKHYRIALFHNRTANDSMLYSQIYNNLGVVYNEMLKKPDSGLYYLEKGGVFDKRLNYANGLCYNYINQASSYHQFANYKKAIELLKIADMTPIREFYKKTKSIIYFNLSHNYEAIGDFKNAHYYSELYTKYSDSINEVQQSIAINEILTKYQTKEKALENIALKDRLQKNRLLMYTFIFLLSISLVVVVLGYKNLTKKRTIAEQEKMIETQKLEKTLKDQELHNIDLMLESQEKERQRIANELHDDLGSMLTTLKINFQNLRRHSDSNVLVHHDIYQKTDEMIEEAYQKVRNISHLKNLGVLGTEGLVAAVKTMAEKMSVVNRLKINVFPYGLNQRLENQKEVLLFRMIQEICHNIIKHSGASEANIYLTQHNGQEMNIIIEDNGRGFDHKHIALKEGIGLRNLEKKTEQMGGTFTIDSIINKGTTIIIDLPI